MRKFVSILLTSILFSACYNFLDPSSGQRLLTTFELRNASGQVTTLFGGDEDVFFHYNVENLKAKDLDFRIQDAGPIVTFEVWKDGVLVGTSDDGFGYAEVIVDSVLRGQGRIAHDYNWFLQDDIHQPLEPGHYVAKAVPRFSFKTTKTPSPDSLSFYVGCHPDSGDCDLRPPVRLTDLEPSKIEKSPFRLNSVSLRGKTLTLNISHSGGCAEHTYELFMSPAVFMESFPVQANLYLRHDDHGDLCEAYLSKDISFDITPIIDSYRESYGGRLDPIILHVKDFSGNDIPNDITVRFTPEGDTSTIIRSGTSFGFCAGYCINELTIVGTDVDFIAKGNPQLEIPERLLEGTITTAEYQALIDAIDMEALFALDDVIGCPDCADGGAEWIEVTNNEGVRKVTFEYNAEIPQIRPLLDKVRVIRKRFRDEMFPPDTN